MCGRVEMPASSASQCPDLMTHYGCLNQKSIQRFCIQGFKNLLPQNNECWCQVDAENQVEQKEKEHDNVGIPIHTWKSFCKNNTIKEKNQKLKLEHLVLKTIYAGPHARPPLVFFYMKQRKQQVGFLSLELLLSKQNPLFWDFSRELTCHMKKIYY